MSEPSNPPKRYTVLFVWYHPVPDLLDRHACWQDGEVESIQFSDLFAERDRLVEALTHIADDLKITDLEGARKVADEALGRPVEDETPE